MRKITIKKLLQETTDKLNLTLLENRQLKERLAEFEQRNDSDEVERFAKRVSDLVAENEQLRNQIEAKSQAYENEIKEIEERNNDLNLELNKLKGEHFDTKKYAEDLKLRLDNAVSCTQSDNAPEEIPEPPPTPTLVTAEEKDENSFNYASAIISEAVVRTAAVTSRLSTSNDENVDELKALAVGRCEILKSEILQTVMSEMLPEAKTTRMDNLLKEANDYFDGILGQIAQ